MLISNKNNSFYAGLFAYLCDKILNLPPIRLEWLEEEMKKANRVIYLLVKRFNKKIIFNYGRHNLYKFTHFY